MCWYSADDTRGIVLASQGHVALSKAISNERQRTDCNEHAEYDAAVEHQKPAQDVRISITAEVHFHFHGASQGDALRALTKEVKAKTARLQGAIDSINLPPASPATVKETP